MTNRPNQSKILIVGGSSFLCHRFYDMNKAQDFGVPTPGTPIERGLREHVESLVSK